MTEQQEAVSDLNSDQLLTAFTRGGFIKWVVLATVVHAIAVVLLSLGSLVKRNAAPAAPAAAEASAEAAAPASGEPNATASTAGTGTTNATAGDQEPTDAQVLEQRSGAPVVKRITDAAKPEDIPAQPGDLGISLEDTKVR